jgi:valyl-tRNA synthetase
MGVEMLPKAYNPKDFEDRIYAMWEDAEAFKPESGGRRGGEPPFVIVIPPPNVTGVLHMGHGLNNTLQDILIRYHRMRGVPTLWVPGTDHAGIATQNVVERRLRERGTGRHQMGREKFVEETWKVKEEHHEVITRQLKKIGASCDWSRERFTLDEGLSKAVREVFVTLYERGLVYRGNYLVNWCPTCGTALSDDEVEHQEAAGTLSWLKYPLEDGSGFVEVATTRPETMLGDTAVAVHPADERYAHLVGKRVLLPLTDRLIPIIADAWVDREFGSGAVKITPAHDPNDWEIGKRHNLEVINVLTEEAKMNGNVPEAFQGLPAKEARRKVLEALDAQGFLKGVKDHVHQVGHCYRCSTVIEPYLSEQWFVRMRSLADKALDAWRRDELIFYPRKWENTYRNWLEGIRDWCISRQLWWGHRIPVWYCGECGEMMVLREDPDSCASCGSTNIRQDEDVLDTWFSSWLWPFSTLGWPGKTQDLAAYYPTTSLVTGYDIIFFWVARMIMAGLEFMNEVPFRDIYITGLVRDKNGRKMSKSLGNGIDPLAVVDIYGADAMRFTLVFLASQGQDILIDMESFKLGSKFANKIWNAARFLLMNMEERNIRPLDECALIPIDRWILHRLNETAATVERALAGYRFNEAAQGVYEFFWNDFCDWYIEASKLSLYAADNAERDRAASLLAAILEESMRLLHPFVSFVSEEIYQKLPNKKGILILAEYPEYSESRRDDETFKRFSALQEMIRGVRTLRSEFTIPPEKKIKVAVKVDADFYAADFFKAHIPLTASLINASELSVDGSGPAEAGAIPVAGTGYESFVFIREAIDAEAETAKMQKEIGKLVKLIKSTEGKLSNDKFISNAPDAVIAKEREKLSEFQERSTKLARYIEELK